MPDRPADRRLRLLGHRFRHSARLLRWRFDRTPESCTYDQLDTPVRYLLAQIFSG